MSFYFGLCVANYYWLSAVGILMKNRASDFALSHYITQLKYREIDGNN